MSLNIKVIKHQKNKKKSKRSKEKLITFVQHAIDNVKKTNQGTLPENVNIVKKCLLIGINYSGSSSQLNGCINDSENIKTLLVSGGYFNENNITMMNDNLQGNLYPSKENILKQFSEIVKFANSNKDKQVQIFVAYSGHGTSVLDENGDENDGYDEALCPIDYLDAGFIIDDDIKANFVNALPSNSKLLMLVDACHSGTMLDLKYEYLANNKNTYSVHSKNSETKCDVVSISGCRDNQTSADAWEYDLYDKRKEGQGAMTASFISCYNKNISYYTLVTKIREWLKKKQYTQVPQLTSGKLIDINSKFILSSFK
ncbi:caspase domain protein [Indivirus ILV1]|uniref:Caspase domain protein n=1 Tax=Indivirus ILV1 TaxID=1977633 RepID=A0A1V0SD98_9VIRU|nr:caspase domain protein [Indivirus ILV1]